MRILIVTPAPPRSSNGNRISALRWAKILRRLGSRVSISQAYDGGPYDLLIALHARRSHRSIKRFHRQHSEAPIIVALTGTDLYRDIRANDLVRQSLEIATRIVALQPKALEELTPNLRAKTRVIYQSVEEVKRASTGLSRRSFDVCVIGHLRAVKDPFRAAIAARLLPRSSGIRILQIGGAMTATMAARAQAEASMNPRYQWLGERPRSQLLRRLARSHLFVLSSRIEGGANALSEAIVSSVPILASRIDGNVGILGPDYPGFFRLGDTRQLARLLTRAENDSKFYAELRTRVRKLAPLFDPVREEQAWARLLDEVS